MGTENYSVGLYPGGIGCTMRTEFTYTDVRNMPYVVRFADPSDAASIVSLIRAVGSEDIYIANEDDYYSADQQQRILSQMNPDVQMVLVAVSGQKIIGTLEAVRGTFRKNRHVATFGMALAAESRGQGRGAGLLRTMEMWAQQHQIHKVALSVFESNGAAIRFYLRHGYAVEASRPQQFYISGHMVAEVFMAKYLPGISSPERQ